MRTTALVLILAIATPSAVDRGAGPGEIGVPALSFGSGQSSGASAILKSGPPTRISDMCRAAVLMAQKRCASSCGSRGYRFSPGMCGVGSTCACGAATGPVSPMPQPDVP